MCEMFGETRETVENGRNKYQVICCWDLNPSKREYML